MVLWAFTLGGCSSCSDDGPSSSSFSSSSRSSCSTTCCVKPKPQKICCVPFPKQYWEYRFRQKCVQLIQAGDYVKFVLPSDYFFVEHTAVLNCNSYATLNMIASFICGLEKMNVKVAGYTDDSECHIRNLALSRQQAQIIANYLWQRIDARVLYATGYGECDPIANNVTYKGRMLNRRVEITLRKITDNYDY